jgi:cell division protein FtsI/penicillin-binding protein 2
MKNAGVVIEAHRRKPTSGTAAPTIFSQALQQSAKPRLINALLALLLVAALSSAQQTRPSTLQPALEHLMAGKAGAIVVINVGSGKILAKSHLDVAAQRLAQPGSTLKPFVLIELLNSGRVKPEQRLVCRRPLYVGGRRMDCAHPPGIESLDAPDAIAYSCNSYFAAMANRLNSDELALVFRREGFTSPTHLASIEATGVVVSARDEPELQLQVLGNWGIEVTPLELLVAYRSLALQKLRSRDLGNAAPVFDGLERAVRYGVAHGAQPRATTAAGKTGTASGTNTRQTHGFFVGYSPADKPEIAIVVYLEHGRGIDAAAIAGKVFDAYWK